MTALEPGLDFHSVRFDSDEVLKADAAILAEITKKVYLVHRPNSLRASMILQKRLETEPKIEILWNTVAKAIRAQGDDVCALDLEDTYSGEKRELNIDGAFIFIGFEPNNQLVPAGTRINADGYAVTHEKCETNIDGIFAVGDLR